MSSQRIKIKGAREHNLKNISLELPRNKLIVFTGISGSGKSTLAFDTIFAEAQRRYLESLSSYARQFLGQFKKPKVEYITGLSPAISIEQKTASHNPRSTVGTVTEIYDYLRLLYARLGTSYCPKCQQVISKISQEEILDQVLELPEGEEVEIYAPMVQAQKGNHAVLLDELSNKGFLEVRIDGSMYNLEDKLDLDRYKVHDIDVLIDRVKISSSEFNRVIEGVETALKLSNGQLIINDIYYNKNLACAKCDLSFPEIEPHTFSFNSPYGACETCHGLGHHQELDAKLIIPDKFKTIAQGGIMPWSYKRNNYYGALFNALASYYRFDINNRIKDIGEDKIKEILYGSGVKLRLIMGSGLRQQGFYINFPGLIPWLKKRYEKTDSDAIRREIAKYMRNNKCPDCHGARLKPIGLSVKINKKNISQITNFSIKEARQWFKGLKLEKEPIARPIISEIKDRLKFLGDVGLDYLTLDRATNTLAGGEAQRIRLASQLGSALVGVLYVLDEPSIGLHARDNNKLLKTLINLRDQGNTVLVIEHDEATIRSADYIVDIGPEAGEYGGEIVARGSLKDILNNKNSITGKYLSGKKEIKIPEKRRIIGKQHKYISIRQASHNNLKNLNIDFPLGVFNCVTGVSGSGKSSLVNDVLYKALARKLHRSLEKPGKHKEIININLINKVIEIDQSPIGRTPRSNPATYTGAFTPIRKIFALTEGARLRGYQMGRFSFNTPGGRCDYCKGEGSLKVEMQFLPDVYMMCEYCSGKRFNKETLEIKYKNRNIAQVLDMTVTEALAFFTSIPEIRNKLKTLYEVGLGYVRLGQAATTLSGGEAQRIKLAKELSRLATGKTLYILDEPTTGLHFEDIKKLLEVLQKLVDAGNTVIVIEHNLDVIKSADYIIDLGPEGGEGGGKLICAGSPEEIIKYDNSYTGEFLRGVLEK